MFLKKIFKISTAIVTLTLLVACAAPTAVPTPQTSPTPLVMPIGSDTEWRLVVIGDSSLWGLGEAYASQIEKDLGVKVNVDDFALPNLSAGSVLGALHTGKSPNMRLEQLPKAVRDAEVVVMFVNPLDSVDPAIPLNFEGCFGCAAPQACETEAFAKYTADMSAIWAKIIELRAGQPTILRATDLYNPLVEQWNSCDIFAACEACWGNLSAAARQAAQAFNIPFLSRFDAFGGEDHIEDPREKGYIRDDGEHPTELAGQFTAELLAKMGYEPLTLP
ncbi:MAG: hypothetical protein A2W35_10595 [Chloroflexi bacterium RBG_16_57_11]|nr:MAG: hypothetical protein A2W35_10595 [Chloroflexi bacterium RBG_16_57_11]